MKSQMKHRSMYALLIAAATMIGITIYGSCSSDDDDYPYLYQEGYKSLASSRMTRSGEETNIVVFPSVSEIIANPTVKAKMDDVWQQTKDAASSNCRKEFAFFIYFDRNKNKYSFSDIVEGEPTICDSTACLYLAHSNNVDRCAWFHTHTTLQYCDDVRRATGPSEGDSITAQNMALPGILYDYSVSEIRGGMSKDLPYKVSTFGPERRVN